MSAVSTSARTRLLPLGALLISSFVPFAFHYRYGAVIPVVAVVAVAATYLLASRRRLEARAISFARGPRPVATNGATTATPEATLDDASLAVAATAAMATALSTAPLGIVGAAMPLSAGQAAGADGAAALHRTNR